jgi:uncharacterized protein (DUF983 family)
MPLMRMVGRAFMLRCPRCGGRGVVRPWARIVDTCPTCEHRFESEEGYWLGAVLINTAAAIGAFLIVFVGTMVLTWPDVPWNGILVATIATMVLIPVLFYPWAKTLWVALDLAFRHPEDLS